MSMKKLVYLLVLLFFASCGGSEYEYKKNPVDEYIRDLSDKKTFTIILHDMDVEGQLFRTYKHQYRIITQDDSIPNETKTDWIEVSDDFFKKHIDNMGMEIAAKTADGKVTKTAAPPGFSNYVGNEKYGHWRTNSSGNSFWEFYGKYAMFSSMLNLFTYPVYQSHYRDYRSNYRFSKPYYGPSGSSIYGTSGKFNRSRSKNSTWFSKASNQSFRNRVRNRVSKSSRSGSRYSRSTSRRRSSRGFGK